MNSLKFKNPIIKNLVWFAILVSTSFIISIAYASIRIDSNSNTVITPLTITPNFAGDSTGTANYCVTLETSGHRNYTVTPTTRLILQNGASGPTIPFTAQWNDGYGNNLPLNYNVAAGPFTSPGATCTSPPKPVTLTILITQANLQAATPGTYTSSLNLTVKDTKSPYSADTATINITLTIPNLVDITKLSDLTFTPTTLTQSENVCVYSNETTPSHNYKITATGNGVAGNPFSIVNGSDYIRYSVTWYNKIGGSSGGGAALSLTSGTATGNITGGSSSLNCGGGNNASFSVTINPTDLYSVPAATYTGTLSFLVAPG